MIESHDYTVTLEGTGPKTGTLTDHTLAVGIDVASPPEFGGPEGVWSPEHLFVAAVSACLMTTFQAIADLSAVHVISYSDQAIGHLQRGEDRRYRIDKITLRPRVVVS
ncbi:MAG: OsmC family protein, partial [Acidimicrobiia bacterium]|nr:OsmC family protein [Acidimicrobiia bacterium]